MGAVNCFCNTENVAIQTNHFHMLQVLSIRRKDVLWFHLIKVSIKLFSILQRDILVFSGYQAVNYNVPIAS